MLQTLKNKLSSLQRHKKAFVGGLILVVIILALPVALFLVNQRQDTRQQAAGTGDQTKIYLTLNPSSNILSTSSPQKILKGTQFEVKVLFDAKGRNVVNMRTQINYDQTKFTLNSVNTQGSSFQIVNTNTTIAPGALRILAETNPTAPVTGNALTVATLLFTATNTSSQLGIGSIYFNTPTEIVEQNPGSTTTVQLTYDAPSSEYEVVDTLPITLSATSAISTPQVEVTTLSPSSIKSDRITARAKINTHGKTFEATFKYSTTNNTCENLSKTTSKNTYSGTSVNSEKTITKTITGLSNNTTYYYCVVIKVAGSSSQAIYGSVLSFNTLAPTLANGTTTPIKSPTGTTTATGTITITITNTIAPITNSPVPSPNQDQSAINISLKLPGIGNNKNGTQNLGENNNPRRTRVFDLYLFDASENQTGNATPVEFSYSPVDGAYKGTAVFSGIPLNAVYTVKAKSDNSVLKNIGFVQMLPGGTVSLNANNPSGELVTGKLNATTPNIIGVQDYSAFMTCFRNQAACTQEMKQKADFTDDSKIDLKDLNILLSAFANRQGD